MFHKLHWRLSLEEYETKQSQSRKNVRRFIAKEEKKKENKNLSKFLSFFFLLSANFFFSFDKSKKSLQKKINLSFFFFSEEVTTEIELSAEEYLFEIHGCKNRIKQR